MDSIRLFLFAAAAAAAVASFYDLRSGNIPNWLSLGVLAAAPLGHFIWGAATEGLHAGLVAAGWSLAGAVACGFIPFLAWRTGSFGGGDVKLLTAIGALCLPRNGLSIEFYAMVVGSIFGLGVLAWNGKLFRTLGTSAAIAVNPLLPKSRRRTLPVEAMTPIRFAPAILGATLLCLLFSSPR
jgi:prepilin peptidase CpaA